MKYVRGSMTVEASLIIPMLMFMVAGVIYSFFFLHDAVLLQNFGNKKAEAILWQREMTEQIPAGMMSVQESEMVKSPIIQVTDWLGNQTSVDLNFEGNVSIELPWISEWTGKAFRREVSVHAIRVDYTKDRAAAALKKKDGVK